MKTFLSVVPVVFFRIKSFQRILTIFSVLVAIAIRSGHVTGADLYVSESASSEWRIVFHTGSHLMAGTNAPVYIELIGEQANSRIIKIKPRRSQFEAGGVDSFNFNTGERDIGQVESINVVKEYSYALFSDWQVKN